MRITRRFAILLAALAVLGTGSGCGGGGDSGSSASPAVAPTIVTPPSSVTVFEGDTARFEVVASGTPPLTYLWLKNDVPIPGATSSVYVTPVLDIADDGFVYRVHIANSAGGVTSAVASLRVNPGRPELSLLAGTSDGIGYFDGPSNAARFATPYALAFDASGNAYISDGGNYVIRKIDATGTVSTLAGAAGLSAQQDGLQGNARFSFPRGLTVDVSGTVYVADYDGNTIRRISAAGAVTTLAGSVVPGFADGTGAGASFDAPSGVALDGQDLLVTDSRNHTIRRVTLAGLVTTPYGQPGTPGTADGVGNAALFTNPWAIAAAGAGRFIVLERSNPARLRLLQGANVTTLATFPAAVQSPEGLAVDSSGNAYVAATFSHAIYRWDQLTGVISVIAGAVGASGSSNGAGPQARFTRPRGLSFRSADELVIADAGNRALRSLLVSTQSVTTFSGSLRMAGNVDGSRLSARFSFPFAIRPVSAAFTAGALLLADFDNNSIRRISAAGDVSTFYAAAAGVLGILPESSGSVLITRPDMSVIERVSPTGVVSLFAGVRNQRGSSDGPLATALFDEPRALVPDGADGFFVVDGNGTIRNISAAGVVSTYAGAAGQKLVVDGPVTQARFVDPLDIVADGCGNFYVLDLHAVRKINKRTGLVSTFAGNPIEPGFADGREGSARFNRPQALAVDFRNYVYVADYFNHVIRRVSIEGSVITIVGSPGIGTYRPGLIDRQLAFPTGVALIGRTLYITHEDGVSQVPYVFTLDRPIINCIR